jgi:hypothetical protein
VGLVSTGSAKEGIEAAYHGAGVGCGHAIDYCTPDVKVCTSAAVGVDATTVAKLGASVDIIFVEEGEAHVL